MTSVAEGIDLSYKVKYTETKEDGRMNYEDKINARLAKIEAERERLLLDLDLLYKYEGQGWTKCQASDSGLVELACWCAECKEYSVITRQVAKRLNRMGA